jgi:O-antigen ligase
VLSLSFPDHERRWSLPNVVFVTYTLFLAGFFFVPNAVDNHKFYIVAVFFPGLFLLPETLKNCLRSPIWLSLLAYLAYMMLSSLWSENFTLTALWRDTRHTAYILSFLLLTLYWFERSRGLPDAIMNAVTLVVILATLISIISFEDLASLPRLPENRLTGLGITDNPNPSAFVYGFFGVVALDYARRHWGETLAYVYAAGVFVIAVFVVLTQSNTGLVALVTASTLLFLLDRRPARPIVIIALFLGVLAAIALAWSFGLISAATDDGFMNRIPIWENILEQSMNAPFFGYGFQQTVTLLPNGMRSIMNYAHNTFLSTLRDGGLVGLLMLLVVFGCALRAALRMTYVDHRARYLCLFVFGLVCMLTDTDQIITRPRELWIILWLPLACLIAYELDLIGEKSPEPLARPADPSPKNT